MMEELPRGWAKLALREICDLSPERVMPSEAYGLPYVGLEHIERDSHRLKGRGEASRTTSIKSRFAAGDVLYGRLRPNLNKVIVADFDGICSTDILVLRAGVLLVDRFLLLILSGKEFREYAVANAKGINLPRISSEAVLNFVARIPPLEEQRRIIDALDVSISALSGVEARLTYTRKLLETMPARILAAATRGQLTRKFRQSFVASGQNTEDSGNMFADESGFLPAGWKSKRVDEAGTVRKGRHRLPGHHQGPNMRPYLRVANVLEDEIDTSDVMSMNFSDEEFERFRLSYGDILLNEGQSIELVGRPAMFRNEMEGVCFTNSLIQFKCNDGLLPEYAILVFRHYLHAGVFRAIAKVTTNLAHLGAWRFAALPFPLPPLEEQKEIATVGQVHLDQVARLEDRISLVASMLQSAVASLRANAISGKLVEQNPNAETVSAAFAALDRSSPKRVISRPTSARPKEAPMKTVRPVVEAARAAKRPMTGQQLFAASGYPEDAASELVERFYLDLRNQLLVGNLRRGEQGGEDLFELVETERAHED